MAWFVAPIEGRGVAGYVEWWVTTLRWPMDSEAANRAKSSTSTLLGTPLIFYKVTGKLLREGRRRLKGVLRWSEGSRGVAGCIGVREKSPKTWDELAASDTLDPRLPRSFLVDT